MKIQGKQISASAISLSSERQDMTDDVTLTGASAVVQLLNPDASGYSVNLPSPTAAAIFVFVNLTDFSVSIKDSGAQVVSIGARQTRLITSEGTSGWLATSNLGTGGSSLAWGSLLFWGDISLSAGDFMQHGMATFDTTNFIFNSSTLAAWWGEVVVTEAGKIEAIEGQTSATSLTLAIHKNGVVADTIVCTVTDGRITADGGATTFAEGDTIAIEVDAISGAAGVALQVLYVPTAKSDAHVKIGPLGLTDAAAGYYWTPYMPQGASTSVNPDAIDFPIPFDTIIRRISWASNDGDNTTQVELLKNAVLHETITWSGAEGVLNLTTPLSVVAGDRITIKRPDSGGGTSPNDSFILLDADGLGQIYGWGTNGSTNTNRFYTPRCATTEAGINGGSTFQTRQYIAQPGVLQGFAWSKSNATAGTLEIYKNGALDETVSLAAATTGYIALSNGTRYERGDYIDIRDNDATDIGRCRLTVYIA